MDDDKLRIITEGPLFTRERWNTIIRMNLGRYERYIADYGMQRVRADEVSAAKPDRTDWNLPENSACHSRVSSLRGAGQPGRIELSVSRNDVYATAS